MNNLNDKVEAQSNGNFGSKEAKAESERLGTLADQKDMYRMGKTPRLRVSRKKARFIWLTDVVGSETLGSCQSSASA
jgi:hypothetical protein